MSTKAYYPISEIGKGKVGFSKTRSIIEAAFYGNNVVEISSLNEAYNLAKNSPGAVITDMPVYKPQEVGLPEGAKVILFNDGAVTGRYAVARRIKGEPGVDDTKLDKGILTINVTTGTAPTLYPDLFELITFDDVEIEIDNDEIRRKFAEYIKKAAKAAKLERL